ncbi:MAG: DUF4124 domain-containing protein [Pseudomonadota bacterium]
MDTHSKIITGTITTLLLTGLVLTGSANAAKMYKWTDENGQVHYSQTKPSSQKADTMHIKDSKSEQQEPPKKDETTQREDQDNPAVQAQKMNCEIGRSNLETYQNSERVKLPDGSVVDVTDDLRKSKIKEAQQMIDNNCK